MTASRLTRCCSFVAALSAGDEDVYGGPDAVEPAGLNELFDGRDFCAAPARPVNPRRHTIATTRPQATIWRMSMESQDEDAPHLQPISLRASKTLSIVFAKTLHQASQPYAS
jgi:hypothetical protein